MKKHVRPYILVLHSKIPGADISLGFARHAMSHPTLFPSTRFRQHVGPSLPVQRRRHPWTSLFAALLFASFILSVPVKAASSLPATGTDDLASLHKLLHNPQPIIWVFTGDSVTEGAKWTGDARPYPSIFAERIRWELRRTRDVVINTAISGDRAQNILDDFNWRIAHLHPDVVSLMIGMNDCVDGPQAEAAFTSNLSELVHRILAIGAIPILHTTNTTLYDRDRIDLSRYDAIIRKVAASNHVILVDNFTYWQQHRTQSNLQCWLGNPIHPNGLGHIQIAQQMLRTLGLFDPDSAVGQFESHAVPAASPLPCPR